MYASDVVRPLALDRVEVDLLTGRAAQMQRAAEIELRLEFGGGVVLQLSRG